MKRYSAIFSPGRGRPVKGREGNLDVKKSNHVEN